VALKRLVVEAFPRCHAGTQVASEDRFVGMCFKTMKIYPLHTVDAQGRQRFQGRPPDVISKYDGKRKHFYKPIYEDWGRKYGWRTRADMVSESSVTFHGLNTKELMKRHHASIYNSCPVGTVLHAAVQKGRDARRNSTVAVV
jgi:hypothetical protein